MGYVKYFTRPPFDKEGFANMLKTMHVKAKAVADGVVFDKDAFDAVKAGHMAKWADVNKKDMRSKLHTREASPAEVAECVSSGYNYMVLILDKVTGPAVIEANDNLDYLERQVQSYHRRRTVKGDTRPIVIVNNTTGNIEYKL